MATVVVACVSPSKESRDSDIKTDLDLLTTVNKSKPNMASNSSTSKTTLKKDVEYKKIVFGGGKFWFMQPPFDDLKSHGIVAVQVGFSGGSDTQPTYDKVLSGTTGHYEVVEVIYDANKISLGKILETYWKNVDPFDSEGQFCDKGPQYASVIFYNNDEEKSVIEQSKLEAQKIAIEKSPLKTKVLPAQEFYKSEEANQDYYLKHPSKFKYYKFSCGRDERLKKIW